MLWTLPLAECGTQPAPSDGGARLTMVVLRAARSVDETEAAFYRDAEREALADGAAAGLIVLAFAATDRDELILFSSEPVAQIELLVARLPFVVAGLVRPEVSEVHAMRFAAVQA